MTNLYAFRLVARDQTRTLDVDSEAWSRLVEAAGAVTGDEPEQRVEVRDDGAKVHVAELRTRATFAAAVSTMESETGERFPELWPALRPEGDDALPPFEARFPDVGDAPSDPLSDEEVARAPIARTLEAALADPTAKRVSIFSLRSLPAELASLRELRHFWARADDDSIELPGPLAELPRLRTLAIGSAIRGVTSDLRRLTALRSLSLNATGIAALPPEIGALRALRELSVSYAAITRCPPEIGYLTALEELAIAHGQLEELPTTLGRLQRLRALDVQSNRLRALPTALFRLGALESLDVSFNPLGALPPAIGQLSKLHTLRALKLGMTDLPASLLELASLRTLRLGYDALSPAAFRTIARLPLASLDLDHVAIPDGARLPPTLTALRWSACGPTPPTLPPAILELRGLTTLDLQSARVREIPDAIFELPLRTLSLRGNGETGGLRGLARATQLESLDLFGTGLTAVPDAIADLAELKTLRLGANAITSLPDWLTRLPVLRELDLGSTNIAPTAVDRFAAARPDVKISK